MSSTRLPSREEVKEQAQALYGELDPLDALRKIAAEGECSISMAGPCVGAIQSRRKRYDNPERVLRIGCAKHFAVEYLAARTTARRMRAG